MMNISLNPHISEKVIRTIIDPAPASGSKACCRPKKKLLSMKDSRQSNLSGKRLRLTAENISQVAPKSLAYVYSQQK